MSGRVRRVDAGAWRDPADVFASLFGGETFAFWLDSGPYAVEGMSYIGSASASSQLITADVSSGTVTTSWPERPDRGMTVEAASVFDVLAADIGDGRGDGGFDLGWVGWFGYELAAATTGAPVADARTPDAAWLLVERMIAFDHRARTVTLVARESDDAESWIERTRAALQAVEPRAPRARQRSTTEPRWRHDATHYAQLIERAHESIRRGDAYQLCLTNEIRIDIAPDPVDVYLDLRASNPVHHGGLLRFGDIALLSASPEQFLHIERGIVTTKPIKGTRPRGASGAEDAALRDELLASDKERAENVMIVDLMRNDLGRIAERGSVTVPVLLDVESYSNVHQLVSTVRAEIPPTAEPLDVVAAAFPAGSMTGAPKIRALSILHELEGGPRGIYAGAFGYLSRTGAVDLAMVIRSIVIDPHGVSIGTGGGITALSVAADEIEETRVKVRALLAVLGVDDRDDPAGPNPLIR
ncbi:aminodeoxychorismate synthase component I [Agromyces atrinae]|uniref:aminodeoxychorismate synthase n=1 Tax=Agromyces atrinae TaxID=592376 RepID=A0A4Q2M2W5_9MICO|nr:aminodeoxychorismate synthase component I [Agromyces atrinae]NYD65972.1 aminodeoxychorismate synthase component I [Agromyces atrinae]RXZ86305.1 aminodeoxychorismate synthase component I [Agromyces atrinae]